MNLEREFFGRKNKFDEERKTRFGGESAAAPLRGHFRPGRAERLSGEWTGSDAAIHTREPGFAQRLRQIGFFGEERCYRARSPEARVEDRLAACGPGHPACH